MRRRDFLRTTASTALAASALLSRLAPAAEDTPRYRLTLGQWTFHRAVRGEPGVAKRDPLEFPTMAGELGFEGADYSGILLGEHHARPASLAELNKRAADAGVSNVLILVDLYDPLGAPTADGRKNSVATCISAKSHDFDAHGDECYTDYARMLRLVADSGYQGWIEVEYEGPGGLPRTPAPQRQPAAPLGEREGALATKRLLQRHLGAALRVKI